MGAYEDYMADNQAGKSHLIGPSGVDGCYRQAAYSYHGVPESDVRSTTAADMGTLLHLGWTAMIKSRFKPGLRDADVPVVIEGLPRPGSADDVDFEHRVVTDLKSARQEVWQSWLNRGGPYETYWHQLELYALGLRQKYGGDWLMRVVALNRTTGEVAEFERAADPEVGAALAAKIGSRHAALSGSAALVASAEDAVHLAEGFPREGRGPGRGMPCDYCPWLSVCWPSPTAPDGTPQSEAVRADAEAIGVLAAEYLEAAAEEAKAKSRKDDARVFLHGVDGDYPAPDGGTVRVVTVGGRERDPVLDCEAAAAALTEAGVPLPMKPGGRTARYPKVLRLKR